MDMLCGLYFHRLSYLRMCLKPILEMFSLSLSLRIWEFCFCYRLKYLYIHVCFLYLSGSLWNIVIPFFFGPLNAYTYNKSLAWDVLEISIWWWEDIFSPSSNHKYDRKLSFESIYSFYFYFMRIKDLNLSCIELKSFWMSLVLESSSGWK